MARLVASLGGRARLNIHRRGRRDLRSVSSGDDRPTQPPAWQEVRSLDLAHLHKAGSYGRDPNIESARAFLPLTHNQLVAKLAVWSLVLDLKVVLPLLFRERIQVPP